MRKGRQRSINIWARILNDKIIGPHFIDRLNSRKYVQILTEILPLLLEDLPLNVRQSMWYQQKGWFCTDYYWIVKQKIWRSLDWSGNNRWAVCFPDLTPIDFYLWGKLKQQVYSEMPVIKENMKERTRRDCDWSKWNSSYSVIYVDTFQKMCQCSGSSFSIYLL